MSRSYDRFAPLTGVAWAVLAVVAVLSGGGERRRNASRQGDLLLQLAQLRNQDLGDLLRARVPVLRPVLRRAARVSAARVSNEPLASLLLAGGVIIAVTAGIGGGIELGIAKNIHHLGPQAAQAVNLVSNEEFLPILIGGFVFAISAGLAILRAGGLPRWLGWVAIVMAIAFVIPPAIFGALILLVLWSLIVSVLMFKRWAADAPAAAPLAA